MAKTNPWLVALSILMLSLAACSARPTQAERTPAPTVIVEPVFTQPSGDLPLTEADVPRVPLEEAKTALDSGAAVLVDVRPPEAFASSHVAGAINIPLADIEGNPADLTLDKDEWIITYCT
jgi:3-mercaptopyruvate sulfurtransferase SseA